ncbi:MAG: branched-chain amino acid ABC transporter permease [Nitrososphaeria archaeon]|nr:branched-chain amino acid ABC transporter permease [Nitrososphaeria archaeon]NIQ33811.1 branched-chain amino acid ABC transporter permease [Nitrososphaeria archaeon]
MEIPISALLQVLISGTLLGGVYALVSVGLTLIYGVMDVVNFAQGELLMISMYISYWIWFLFGLDPLIALPVATIILFLIGTGIQKILINPVLKTETFVSQVFVTFGLLLFLQNLAFTVWSAEFRMVTTSYTGTTIPIGGALVSIPRLLAFIIAVLATLVLYIFLNRTDVGLALRATSQSKEAAEILGVNVHNMYLLAFGIGAACTGVAGALVSTFFYITPQVGLVFIIVAFVAVVLGGLGNYVGALFGGIIIGITESVGVLIIGSGLKQTVYLIIFVIILLFRPQGLLGGRR